MVGSLAGPDQLNCNLFMKFSCDFRDGNGQEHRGGLTANEIWRKNMKRRREKGGKYKRKR
jgi:hypothetical protein